MITGTDTRFIVNTAKLFTHDFVAEVMNAKSDARLNSVVEYIAIAKDLTEIRSILWWWNEGVRDVVHYQDQIAEVLEMLQTAYNDSGYNEFAIEFLANTP